MAYGINPPHPQQVQVFARVHLLSWLGVSSWATGPLLPFLLLFPHSAGDTMVTVPSSHRQVCLPGNSCSHHHGPGHSREGHIGGQQPLSCAYSGVLGHT